MAFYGFEIVTKDSASAPLDKIGKKLGETASKAEIESRNINDSLKNIGEGVTDRFNEIRNGLLGIFAIEKVREFGAEILKTTTEFQGFDNRIKFASNSIVDAGENTAFLKQQIESLKLPAKQVYEGFSEMQMGLVGTGIEGAKLRTLFEGFTIAGATGHLDSNQIQRSLYDLKEIGEIGLNKRIYRSLSVALPGFNAVIKEAFGKTFDELEKSGMTGAKFLEGIGPALKKHFESGLGNWQESLQAQQNDFGNKMIDFQLELGTKLEPAFKSMFKAGVEGLKSLTDMVKGLDLSSLANWGKLLIEVGGAFVLLKGATMGYNVALTAYNTLSELSIYRTLALESGMGGLQATTVALTETFVGLESTLMTLGGAIVAFGLIKWAEEWRSVGENIDKAADKLMGFKKVSDASKGLGSRYSDVNDAFVGIQRDLQSKNLDTKNAAKERASKLLGDLPNLLNDIRANSSDLNTSISKGLQNINVQDSINKKLVSLGGTWINNPIATKEKRNIEQLNSTLSTNNSYTLGLSNIIKKLKEEGIKPQGAGAETSHANAADSIGILGGAAGGLDKAKIINIKIDTMQKIDKVTGIDDFKKASSEVMDIFLRMFNNVSNGSAATI
jgi:hypothetical protein